MDAHTHVGRERYGRQKRFYSFSHAQAAIGELEKGSEIFCLTNGQFSLFDVVEVVLSKTGPADVIISTWTAAGADTKRAKAFVKNGAIRSIRWIVDRSFKSRQPGYCRLLVDEFGDCLRTLRTHCKFIVVTNDDWDFVIRTSMNLNSNPRIEDFEISEDEDFANFFIRFTDEVFEKFPPDDLFNSDANKKRLTGWDEKKAASDGALFEDVEEDDFNLDEILSGIDI